MVTYRISARRVMENHNFVGLFDTNRYDELEKEVNKLLNKVSRNGYSLIPLDIHFKNGKAKVTLGVCKGKKLYDKRETIKERDLKRENARLNSYK